MPFNGVATVNTILDSETLNFTAAVMLAAQLHAVRCMQSQVSNCAPCAQTFCQLHFF